MVKEDTLVREMFAVTIKAHGKDCMGCIRHKKELMISFQTEKRGKIYDLFLGKELALSLQEGINRALLEGERL